MANSYPEHTVCFDKRLYLGPQPIACCIPVVDPSLNRYNTFNRKPITVPGHRDPPYLPHWETTHNHDYRPHSLPEKQPHRFFEVNSHELAVNPGSITQKNPFTYEVDFLKNPKFRANKQQQSHGITGLERESSVNFIRWQDPKEIVGTHPREIIPKHRDIRYLRKHRMPYMDNEKLYDGREEFKVIKPGEVKPVISRKLVEKIMVSEQPTNHDSRIILPKIVNPTLH